MSTSHLIDNVDYGPLAALIGLWKGDKGVDRAPEPEGEARSLFYETILFEACGDVDNANEQVLAVVRYHQVVSRKTNDKVFHNETGYWSWDAKTGVLMQSLTIPRGFALVAGGAFAARDRYDGEIVLEVAAKDGDPSWGMTQSPFLRAKARTLSFTHRIVVQGDSMSYSESTLLNIYGREYNHTDVNRLTRSAAG
ncbi:MAG TPA: heme-binding beta-barrel domain-containing protein [Nevskiaceae bacterium]|nr:heme-binding beta-barrel domain-containing protein [Nevskiaceae bacterium]